MNPSLIISRYHLPGTEYFNGMRAAMPLETLAGYAESYRRATLYGPNLRNEMDVPLSGSHEYSPFGAGIVERIREFPEEAHHLTGRWQRALVASPATAILGLGSASVSRDEVIRAEAADVIMQGKAKFFLETAGVSATPLCFRSYLTKDQLEALDRLDNSRRKNQARIWRALNFAEAVKAIACNFGFINIEDAQGRDLPLIFGVLECLAGECAIWSDDKQGTGVITAAGFLSWMKVTNRKPENCRGIILGAGAGAMGVYDELVNHGILPENILVTDSKGVLHEGRADVEDDEYKRRMRHGIKEGAELEEFARGADFVVNLGAKESLTDDLARTEIIARALAPNPLFAPMTNPEPGVTPDMLAAVRPDAHYGSGNQQYINTFNNFTAFGQIGAGVLMSMAGAVTPGMTKAAALGISRVAEMDPRFGKNHLVPKATDIRLIEHEAGSVARAAARDGVSLRTGKLPTSAQLERFDAEISEMVRFRTAFVQNHRDEADARGRKYFEMRYPDRFAPFYLSDEREGEGRPEYYVPPEIERTEFEHLARQLALKEERWQRLLLEDGRLHPKALTTVLNELKPATRGESEQAKIAYRELCVIVNIATVCPALGLALALRRTRVRPENAEKKGPTVFHREAILSVVLREVPEARKAIYSSFHSIPEIGHYNVGK
ncbi:MAG TPA: malic enzyme-like NAD(P)-binding protein [bacterium]|nr:malic enzyme-like NAD(P)-binding protein [bacterium]